MKKIFALLTILLNLTIMAQSKIETYDFGTFKLHVYYSGDVMNDASYIIEGADSLVTMEEPLFKVNVKEFNEYLDKLGKPVEKTITDYHVGGTADRDLTMAHGMEAFSKGPVYGGMMKSFQKAFGDSMVDLPTGKVSEVDFGKTCSWAGVTFEFRHGASTDFPAASIIIGGKVYYTHWAPAKAHVSNLQVSSRAAVDAEIAEAQNELNSGCELLIGGHGGASKVDAVKFKIEYLNTVKSLLAENSSADAFVKAMKSAYPELPGSEGLDALAASLCK